MRAFIVVVLVALFAVAMAADRSERIQKWINKAREIKPDVKEIIESGKAIGQNGRKIRDATRRIRDKIRTQSDAAIFKKIGKIVKKVAPIVKKGLEIYGKVKGFGILSEQAEAKPSRSRKPRSDKPRSRKPRSDKPRSRKPKSDKPRSRKPRSDKPRSRKPRSDKPAKEQKPRSRKPRSDKPRSRKPKSDKPRSRKPRSRKPKSEKTMTDAEFKKFFGKLKNIAGKVSGVIGKVSPILNQVAPKLGGKVDKIGGILGMFTEADAEAETDATRDCGMAFQNGQQLGNKQCVLVQGKPVVVETAIAFERMNAAAKAAGIHLQVNSGFRTQKEQEYLYGCYQSKKCNNGNLAARPGYSNHQNGRAMDISCSNPKVFDWMRNNASKFGFIRTVASENWHWELLPGRGCASSVKYACK